VHFCLNPHQDGQVLIGSGIDLSDSGMSMFSSYPLKKGQGIVFRSRLPVLQQRAIVKWVKALKVDWYQVGLEFTG